MNKKIIYGAGLIMLALNTFLALFLKNWFAIGAWITAYFFLMAIIIGNKK